MAVFNEFAYARLVISTFLFIVQLLTIRVIFIKNHTFKNNLTTYFKNNL